MNSTTTECFVKIPVSSMPSSYSSIHCHLVFSTKDRIPFLTEPNLRAEIHNYIGGVSKRLGCQPLIVGGVEDHVHILAGLSRTSSAADWAKEVKRISSGWIKQRDKSLANFAWQGGYGVFSVDNTSMARIRNYIHGQEEHHRTVTFQDEFRALLTEHGIEWDEKYIWE